MINVTDKKVQIASAYYDAMSRKNIADLEQCIHPDIQFIAPLAKAKGKSDFLEGVKRFIPLFNTLKIHAKFGDSDHAVIIYDLDCPEPIGQLRATALMSFKEDLIFHIELLYDPRPFIH